MNDAGSLAMTMAGALTALAALAHLACLVLGASAFRFMGAGERMARAVEAGRRRPLLVTWAIAAMLATWAAYAFSAAGLIGALPWARWVLPAVAAIFLARGVGFAWLKPFFPENSDTFWWVSSGICVGLGSLYAWGTVEAWARL